MKRDVSNYDIYAKLQKKVMFLKQLLQGAKNRGLVDNISLFSFHSFFKNSNDVL